MTLSFLLIVNAQSIAQLLQLRLTVQPPLSVVYKSSLLYDQSPDLVFSYISQYKTLSPFSIPSLPLHSISTLALYIRVC